MLSTNGNREHLQAWMSMTWNDGIVWEFGFSDEVSYHSFKAH